MIKKAKKKKSRWTQRGFLGGWMVGVLWYINSCGLFNAKSCLYIYIYIYIYI